MSYGQWLAKLAKECRCCIQCSPDDVPCGGLMAGGFCDRFRCTCDDELDYDDRDDDAAESEVGPDPGRAIRELYEVLGTLTTAISDDAQRAGQTLDRVVAARLKLEWAVDDLAQALGYSSVTKR